MIRGRLKITFTFGRRCIPASSALHPTKAISIKLYFRFRGDPASFRRLHTPVEYAPSSRLAGRAHRRPRRDKSISARPLNGWPALLFLLAAGACGGGGGRGDADGDAGGEAEAAEDLAPEAEGDDTTADGTEGDAADAADAADGDAGEREWERYVGEVPVIAPFSKESHVASCMRTRACSPENRQQLATCTSAYAHIVGREVGITSEAVARCVNGAAGGCDAVRACLGGGAAPVACTPLETPDACEGSVLAQCSRASALLFVFDCASVGLGCLLDREGAARCGLGGCDPAAFLPGCSGDTLVVCDTGVVVPALCTGAGLSCVEPPGEGGRCAGGGAPCDEALEPRRCDGAHVTGCVGGRMADIDCATVVEGWTCGATEGTYGCVPPGDECWAYPLIGSSIEESCDPGGVVSCLDGSIQTLSCDDYGLGPCVDLGTAARCTPPP